MKYVPWPDGVPACAMPLGATGGLVDTRYSFETESSIQPVQRPRSTWAPDRYQIELTPLSRNQLATFQTWYRDELAYGTRAFLMLHPIFRVPQVWRIVKADPPYQVRKDRLLQTNDKRGLTVSFTVQSMPGGAGERLVYYPAPSGAAPGLILDFVRDFYSLDGVTSAPMPLHVSRPSAGTRWNADGLIESVPPNTLRRDHGPETCAPLGALVEDQSTNILLDSQNFAASGTDWVGASDFTITPVTSVIAGGTAWQHDNLGIVGSRGRSQDVGVLTGSAETMSCIVENVDAARTHWGIYDLTASAFVVRGEYHWGDGVASIDQGSGTVTAEVLQEVGPNGGRLVRLSATGTGSAGNSRRVMIYVCGVLKTFRKAIVHAAQHEERAYATSYIPTTSAQVTRAHDSITLSADRFTYNTAEGTYAIAHEGIDDSNWRSIYLRADAAPGYREYVRFGGDFRMTTGTTVMSKRVVPEFPSGYAMAADASGMSLSVEGAAIEAGSALDQSTGAPGNLYIGGSGFDFGAINGHFKLLRYWPERLPDSDLVELSA